MYNRRRMIVARWRRCFGVSCVRKL